MTETLLPGTGVVIEWFDLYGGFTDPAIVPEMERDRLDYAAQPGFIRKLLVVAAPPAGGELGGGIYFLRDVESARTFLHWATQEHVDPDGRIFEDREYVGAGHGYVGELIGHVGAAYTAPLPAAVRVQRFVLRDSDIQFLVGRWATMSYGALQTGMLGVSLVHDAQTGSVFIISVSDKRCSSSTLGDEALTDLVVSDFAERLLANSGADLVDDILFWVFTVWENHVAGQAPLPATWPNSPPLPHPAYWKD